MIYIQENANILSVHLIHFTCIPVYHHSYHFNFKKLNIELPSDPEILLLDIYPNKVEAGT